MKKKVLKKESYYLIVNGKCAKIHKHRKFLEIYARENDLKNYEIKEGKQDVKFSTRI